jgi:hypothetical protein
VAIRDAECPAPDDEQPKKGSPVLLAHHVTQRPSYPHLGCYLFNIVFN